MPQPGGASLAPLLHSANESDPLRKPPQFVVSCPGPDGEAFADAVAQALGCAPERAGTMLGLDDEAWLPARAVAAHATGLRRAARLAVLSPRDPRPLHKHPDFVRFAVPVAILAGLLVTGVALEHERRTVTAEYASLVAKNQTDNRLRAEAEARGKETATLHQQLAARRAEAADIANRMTALDDGMAQRLDLVPGVLRGLSEAIPSDVVLEAIEEAKSQGGFHVKAWSSDATAIHTFAALAQLPLRKLGHGVTNTALTEARGRAGEPGYAASFWIVSDPDAMLPDLPSSAPARLLPAAPSAAPAARAKPGNQS